MEIPSMRYTVTNVINNTSVPLPLPPFPLPPTLTPPNHPIGWNRWHPAFRTFRTTSHLGGVEANPKEKKKPPVICSTWSDSIRSINWRRQLKKPPSYQFSIVDEFDDLSVAFVSQAVWLKRKEAKKKTRTRTRSRSRSRGRSRSRNRSRSRK